MPSSSTPTTPPEPDAGKVREEARRALLTPLTDEEAARLTLPTKDEVEAALNAPMPTHYARALPAGRFRV